MVRGGLVNIVNYLQIEHYPLVLVITRAKKNMLTG